MSKVMCKTAVLIVMALLYCQRGWSAEIPLDTNLIQIACDINGFMYRFTFRVRLDQFGRQTLAEGHFESAKGVDLKVAPEHWEHGSKFTFALDKELLDGALFSVFYSTTWKERVVRQRGPVFELGPLSKDLLDLKLTLSHNTVEAGDTLSLRVEAKSKIELTLRFADSCQFGMFVRTPEGRPALDYPVACSQVLTRLTLIPGQAHVHNFAIASYAFKDGHMTPGVYTVTAGLVGAARKLFPWPETRFEVLPRSH